MANYVISGLQTTQQALEGNDTLLVEKVGSIVYSGNDAIIWNLTTAAQVPPGVVIVNDGLIQSLTDRAIDTSGNNGSSARSISLTNNGTITSPDDAIRINDNFENGTVVIANSGTISATGSGQAIDFNGVEDAASIVINNLATGLIHAAAADAVRPGAGATVNNWGHI